MTTPTRLAGAVAAACLAFTVAAQAQTPAAAPAQQPNCPCGVEQTAPPPPPEPAGRPSTTTVTGDTGLWFVPTADVLARGMVSASGYRAGFNYTQGFTNVGEFRGTFAVGAFNRTEIFGALTFDRRVDRDVRPVFTSNQDVGGLVLNYPLVNQYLDGRQRRRPLSRPKNGPAPGGARRFRLACTARRLQIPTARQGQGNWHR